MEIKILCPEKWSKTWVKSQNALNDQSIHYNESLQYMLVRLMSLALHDNVNSVRICSDFCDDSFLFAIERKDGSTYLNGGIIFHGFPKDGFVTNGSVCLSPQYGWAIHT